jgi:hypothetical protein
MSFILRRTLIFVGLMLAGLVLYSLWFGIKADRYDETAIPYLDSAMPMLTSWQYQQLKPLLSPGARLDFENEKVRSAYQAFSQLGQCQSMDRPRYSTSYQGSSKELGDVDVVEYQAVLQFDTGPALIKIKLVTDGESYFVHHFGIQSEIFANPVPSQ